MQNALLIGGNLCLQLLVTVGVIVLAGLILAAGKRLFLRACGAGAYRLERITGIVGTPVHELSHALFCVLFGHKITEICLWSPHASGGALGYVRHSYRKKNLWHQIGNFFIGIAPILGGSAVLVLLLRLLLPGTAASLFGILGHAGERILGASGVTIQSFLSFGRLVLDTLQVLFAKENFAVWQWYLYLFLAVLILIHMEVSRADIKSGWIGFLFLFLLLLLCDTVLFFVYPNGLAALTSACLVAGAFLAAFLTTALVLSCILSVFSLLLLLIHKR